MLDELSVRKRQFSIKTLALASILAVFPTLAAAQAAEDTKTLTFLGPGEKGGPTYSVLALALSKMDADATKHQIVLSPKMNKARARKSLLEKAYPLAIRRFEADEAILNTEKLIPIRFPVYLGVLGYRLCYVNEKNESSFRTANELDQIRMYTFGFVEGWRDIAIFKHNKYQVRESVSVSSLYKQLAVNRIDVVCRAVIEIESERSTVEELGNIALDESKMLFYPMPYFFFVHKDHKALADQIEQGLITAYNDGSYQKLWDSLYAHHFNNINLADRKVIELANPLDEHIPFQYRQYLPKILESKASPD